MPQLQSNTELRPLRDFVEAHLGEEVVDTAYGDRFGEGGGVFPFFLFGVRGREEDGLW